jgi:hypothetical protein
VGETTLNKKMRAFDDEVALTVAPFYLVHMLQRTFPAGFIAPCLPTKTDKLPSGGDLLHEIKQAQNSRDPLLVLVRFILIFLPGCTLPRFGGAFLFWPTGNRIPPRSIFARLRHW